MLVAWKIRFISRETRELDDRTLVLDTAQLEPAKKAAIELVLNQRGTGDRSIIKYREWFEEKDIEDCFSDPSEFGEVRMTCVPDYFEDDAGKEVSLSELGQIRTGNPNTRMFSSSHRPHDIQLEMANPSPTPIAEVKLTTDEVRLLGYFERDLRELVDSAFYREGPGTIEARGSMTSPDSPEPDLKTAVSDEEIRSAVTTFRRLYMKGEPANFFKAVEVYSNSLAGHPFADWVKAEGEEYETQLTSNINFLPFAQNITFSRKRLIDVFLYTQYHHQPDELRQRQYKECLKQVHGKKQLLTFMFLAELHKVCLAYSNAGRVIAAWFRRYCEHHKISADVLQSLRHDNPHLGVVEKKADRAARLFREQVENLAVQLWNQQGCPSSGPDAFMTLAEQQLRKALNE